MEAVSGSTPPSGKNRTSPIDSRISISYFSRISHPLRLSSFLRVDLNQPWWPRRLAYDIWRQQSTAHHWFPISAPLAFFVSYFSYFRGFLAIFDLQKLTVVVLVAEWRRRLNLTSLLQDSPWLFLLGNICFGCISNSCAVTSVFPLNCNSGRSHSTARGAIVQKWCIQLMIPRLRIWVTCWNSLSVRCYLKVIRVFM